MFALVVACATAPHAHTPATSRVATPPDGPRPASPPLALRDPGWLPIEARDAMAVRMQRHGADMVFLMAAILMLDHEEAERLAMKLASEPRMGRPAAGEVGTLSALLPEHFFDLQDQLLVRSSAVASAARRSDDGALAKAYGALAETCVACHSAYLGDDAEEVEPEGIDLIGDPSAD